MSGEHTHETGGAWHVTRWAVPGCPDHTPTPEPSEVAEATAGEWEWWPCCEHCGPPTNKALPGAEHGNGGGHDEPCGLCERRRVVELLAGGGA